MALLYTAMCWWMWESPAWSECRRVIEQPDGVSIIIPALQDRRPGETEAEWCTRAFQRTMAANPAWQGLPFHDVESALLPTDRTQRHKWRFKNGRVTVDPLVPDPPKSKDQARQEACAQAQDDVTTPTWLKEFCATF